MMSTGRTSLLAPLAAVACVAVAVPAAAQFSDSYKFLKAVKDKDGVAAKKILNEQGSSFVNVKDGATGDAGLHIAVRRSDPSWVVFLLQENADANIRNGDGDTPLLLSAALSFDEGIRVLLSVGAQVDTRNRLGETALLKAVQRRDTVAARLLLDANANPDLTDNTGNSPRSVALADPRGGPLARMLKDAPARKPAPAQGPVL